MTQSCFRLRATPSVRVAFVVALLVWGADESLATTRQDTKLRLLSVTADSNWQRSSARILVDAKTGDFKIGDVLPNGMVLSGIQTDVVELFTVDGNVLALPLNAEPHVVVDLSHAFHAPRRSKESRYIAVIQRVVAVLPHAEPVLVQEAIDELIAMGEPAVGPLRESVQDPRTLVADVYAFPSGGPLAQPPTVGSLLMLVLEAITGLHYGDPTDSNWAEIAKKWHLPGVVTQRSQR